MLFGTDDRVEYVAWCVCMCVQAMCEALASALEQSEEANTANASPITPSAADQAAGRGAASQRNNNNNNNKDTAEKEGAGGNEGEEVYDDDNDNEEEEEEEEEEVGEVRVKRSSASDGARGSHDSVNEKDRSAAVGVFGGVSGVEAARKAAVADVDRYHGGGGRVSSLRGERASSSGEVLTSSYSLKEAAPAAEDDEQVGVGVGAVYG